MAAACPRVDSQVLATILDPFRTIFPESASEGFLLSTPSPGGVDRARNDAGTGRDRAMTIEKSKENFRFFIIFSLEASKTKGFSTFWL